MAKRSEKRRYVSDNTVNSALRTLGYDTKEQITGHGFRATARTLIRELLGWDREIIEQHLAHVSDEELGSSYDRTTHFEQLRRMIRVGRICWTTSLMVERPSRRAICAGWMLRRCHG